VIDVNGTTDVSSSKTISSAGYSIYDGWKLKGRIVHTLVRGAFAMRDGALNDACIGRGRYLRRKLSAA
jgi:dihydroorotase-like cyclic amidohydrolase